MGDSGMLELSVRLFISLALVLGLLYLIARVANRRFVGRAGAPIQVVHRQQLSKGSSVAVVAVGTRVLVLGTTDHQVTLLTEVEPDEVGLDPDTMLPEELEDPLDGEAPTKAMPVTSISALSGSLLSPATWRRTWEQFRPSSGSSGPVTHTNPDSTAPENDRRAS